MATRGAPKTRLVPKSSLNRALNALGDRWSLLVIQEAFLGATRFEEFHERLGGARSTLSSRLQALERHNILVKRPQKDDGARMAYHLTPRGLDLFDSMMVMWGWGVRWGVTGRRAPTVFIHEECGKAMLPEVLCAHCHEPLSLHTCS
jgi:DNA-binding HxlR family transcriptional regulator